MSGQSDQTQLDAKSALDETLEELRTSLEELQVAEEELRIQNDELFEARNEIEKERLRYQHLFEFAPDGYIVTSVRGKILEANQAAANMLSMIQDFLPGKHLASFIEEEDRREFRDKLNELNQPGITSPKEIEVRILARTGRMLDIEMAVAVVCDERQQPQAFRWLLRDVTQRKRAEEEVKRLNAELERRVAERTAELEVANRAKDELLVSEQKARAEAEAANKSKDEFLAVVSHELRTPLNAILGWTQILRNGMHENQTAHALEVIDRNAKAQAQIVSDILEVSRIITGNLHLEKDTISMKPVVEAAIDSLQQPADAKQVRLTSSIHHAMCLVSGDPNRLQQVVLNLLSNAIKFTPSGGSVHVQLERVNDYARLTVSDTGEGIPRKFLPYIFDRFRQADNASTRKYGGLGLGLSIVQHIVKMHGGEVQAASEGVGKGATFTVDLPLVGATRTPMEADSQSQPVAMPTPASAEPDLKGIWVVVIDDEQDAREMIQVILQQLGAKVTALETVPEVIDALAGEAEGRRPDVLVADIAMPVEDGFDLIRKVRKLEPERGGTIPAIALTAYAAREDRLKVLSEGYQLHLAKPVSLIRLAANIERLARNGEMN